MSTPRLRLSALSVLVGIGVLLVIAALGSGSGHARPRALRAEPVAARASHTPAAGKQPQASATTPPKGAHCRGLVALTFDDGPSATVTPRLIRILKRLHVRATFFMVGSRVAASPTTARAVYRAGFAVGNHTWAHADLALQSRAAARDALQRTERALRRAGVQPTRLMRPPYGALDATARQVIHNLGLVPVLWTIDSRDWQSGSTAQIAHRILSALRPGPDNIVLQHDGVNRSPISIRAVARVVHVGRQRGYCFVGLDKHGRPTWPRGYHPHQH